MINVCNLLILVGFYSLDKFHYHVYSLSIEDGRGMAKGFYQALFLTQAGPTLNINLTFTCFYMPLSFIDFASQYLRKDITKGLHEKDLKAFEQIVKNLLSKSI